MQRHRALERTLVRTRWLGVLLGLYLIPRSDSWPPPHPPHTAIVAGLALIAGLALGNVGIWYAARRATSVGALRAVGRVAFGVDIAAIVGLIWAFSYSPVDVTWVAMYVLPLEGAARYEVRGAMGAVGVMLASELAREAYLAQSVPGYDFVAAAVVFRVGMGAIIAIVAGFTCRSVRQEARAHETVAARAAAAERELRESYEALRKLDQQRRMVLARLVGAQEEERARIAGDVHDDPLQKVVAATMRADLLAQQLRDPDRAREAAAIQETLRAAIEQLRHLLVDLRLPVFDSRGLAEAIRQHAGDAGIADVRVRDRLASEPPQGIRVILYRIAQEVLTNIRKHAQASNVDIVLEDRDEGCYVRIADDGVGFRVEENSGTLRGHLGLVEIRERAEVAGGWCSVRSLPGHGAVVEFWVPLRTAVGRATVFDVSDGDGVDARPAAQATEMPVG